MESRREIYDRKVKEISSRCEVCRKGAFPPSVDRCDECTTGRKLRMLEAEFADVTGWSHKTWKT